MSPQCRIEIRAGVDDLLRRVKARGPIKDPEAAVSVALMQQLFTFIERNEKSVHPDEDFQRRMLDAAKEEWHNTVVLLDWAPALKTKQDRSKGGKKAAANRTRLAAQRLTTLRAEAAKLEKMEPGIKKEAVAAMLADRGLGGKDAIAKLLRGPSKKSSESN